MTVPLFLKPVRVLHVVRPAAGGIRQHVRSLLNGLDPAEVVSSAAAPREFLADISDCVNLSVSVRLDISSRLSPGEDLKLSRILAGVQPQFSDIVHAHGVRAAWVAALACRHRFFPLIFTAHNQIERGLPARLALAVISRQCTQILAVSEAVADSLAACGVARPKITVVPNGVAVAFFRAGPSRAEARAEFSLPESAFVVAAAGRLSPEKGIDILLQAARRRKAMTFLVAGGGPLFAALSHGLPPNVRLLGHADDVRPLLAAADVFAMPSRREGQGIAALEAMAAGVPVVASRIGGLAEMLTDSETALLIPPADPEALAAALNRLQDDSRLRRKLAGNARALVEERYGLQAMLDTLTQIYQKAGS